LYCRIILDGDRNKRFDVQRLTPRMAVINLADPVEINLNGSGLDLTFSGTPMHPDDMTLATHGGLEGTWSAVRTSAARPTAANPRSSSQPTEPHARNYPHPRPVAPTGVDSCAQPDHGVVLRLFPPAAGHGRDDRGNHARAKRARVALAGPLPPALSGGEH